MTPPVTVAVVSASAREHLRRCLASLRADHEAGRADVWVVDNASTDGAPDLVREEFGWANLIASAENLGFGRAVNLVAARTASPWLATANDDVAVEPDAIARLLAAGAAAASVGTVAPRLLLPDGSTQHSAFAFPSPAVAVATELGAVRFAPRLAERLCLLGAWDPDRPRRVPWAIAAFSLVRRAAFDAVGGFDARQWMYAEDLSLGWRLDRAGWPTRYEPAARVQHHGGASTQQAFGDERVRRQMTATYAWMTEARGVPLTRATAGIGWTANAARASLWGLTPQRYGPRRDRARFWRDVHRLGLR